MLFVGAGVALHWPLFNTLRDWRSEPAEADGFPPYVICNNRQLAGVLRLRPFPNGLLTGPLLRGNHYHAVLEEM